MSMHASSQGRTYHLEVVQHPERSAACASSVLSRLPLAPPPIVQLTIRDCSGIPVDCDAELPLLVAHLSLYSECARSNPFGVDDSSLQPAQSNFLYGTLVSSVQTMQNVQGIEGSYFVFPDVSICRRGRYALRIDLMRIQSIGHPTAVGGTPIKALAHVITRTFDIVSKSNYVTPEVTSLTQCFARQGMYGCEPLGVRIKMLDVL